MMFKRWLCVLLFVIACGDEEDRDESADGGGMCDPDEAKADREFVQAHNRCTADADCVIVGACSGEWSFQAVSRSASAEASQRSRNTKCPSFDGPIYDTACRDNRCTLIPTGRWCGQAPIDSGLPWSVPKDAQVGDADAN